MRTFFYLITAILLLSTSCSRSERPTPRRVAFHRIEALPDSFISVVVGGYNIEINAAAIISSPKDGWLDVEYPRFGATLHLTATTCATAEQLADAIENRLERMSLNMGDSPARELRFTNDAGFKCRLLSSQGGTTPLQMLAIGPQAVVSGVVVFKGSTTPADSIAPIIGEIDAQMVTLLKALRRAD